MSQCDTEDASLCRCMVLANNGKGHIERPGKTWRLHAKMSVCDNLGWGTSWNLIQQLHYPFTPDVNGATDVLAVVLYIRGDRYLCWSSYAWMYYNHFILKWIKTPDSLHEPKKLSISWVLMHCNVSSAGFIWNRSVQRLYVAMTSYK